MSDSVTRLEFDQSYDENRRRFITRLMEAGWAEDEAAREWDNIQSDTEGEL